MIEFSNVPILKHWNQQEKLHGADVSVLQKSSHLVFIYIPFRTKLFSQKLFFTQNHQVMSSDTIQTNENVQGVREKNDGGKGHQ